MDNFFSTLESEYSKQLKENNTYSENEIYKLNLTLINDVYSKLKNYISSILFENEDEEINYFKNIKPKYQSELIFYTMINSIISKMPIGSIEKKKDFLIKQLDKMSTYFEENIEFIKYVRSGSTEYDSIYFLRENAKFKDCSECLNSEIDFTQCTGYSSKIAKTIAYERLERFLYFELRKLNQIEDELNLPFENDNFKIQDNLSWSDTKIALIELIYSLQSAGAINNGNTDIKTIAANFSKIFNIDVGDIYKGYMEIKERKSNTKTKFLEKLIISLSNRIENDDSI